MQWQHGTYTAQSDGSLVLTPIAVDGRQLVSDPCATPLTSYTRYNQTEEFKVCFPGRYIQGKLAKSCSPLLSR